MEPLEYISEECVGGGWAVPYKRAQTLGDPQSVSSLSLRLVSTIVIDESSPRFPRLLVRGKYVLYNSTMHLISIRFS